MIVFTLKCRKDHRFEGWFRNGDAYEAQAKGREIACPQCGDTQIGKAPMAPAIVSGASAPRERAERSEPAGAAPPPAAAPVPADPEHVAKVAALREMLTELRTEIEKNADYVGPEFAEEARAIHYGEKAARPIYGESSDEQAKELAEEGIEFARIPWLPRQN